MSPQKTQLNPEEKVDFFEASQRMEAMRPQFLKIGESPEASFNRQQYTYHFIAAELADEGLVLDIPAEEDVEVVKKTMAEWHGLWFKSIENLLNPNNKESR